MADVFANNRAILHQGDGLTHTSGPPDVCKTPSPGGPVPIPYPNIAMDSDLAKGAKKVKINGNPVATEASNLSTSTGDEAGTAGGGIASSKTKGKLTWGSASTDVKAEGNGVVRFMDVTQHNGNVWNTVIVATGSATTPGYGDDSIDLPDCAVCGEPKGKHRIESDDAVLQLAQQLATHLKDPNRAFAKAFKKPKGGPLKKGVMIGVLACQCEANKKYAGLAGAAYDDGAFLASANAFNAEAGALGLTPIVAPPSPPPLSGQSPPAGIGAISSSQWSAVTARVEGLNNQGLRGNLALTCAAPKMAQKCLSDGHKPGKMVEIWVGMATGSAVTIPRYVNVVFDFTTGHQNSPQVSQQTMSDQAFGDGDAVPSCTTCQVVMTVMLCNLGQPPCP